MKRDIAKLNFLTALKEKIADRTKLTNLLVDLLEIEKEAVYRRLRGEVPFTFSEVIILSKRLGISLDNITEVDSGYMRPFSMVVTDMITPTEHDENEWEHFMRVLGILRKDPEATIGEVWNTLPFPITYPYEYLTRYYLFRWCYQQKNTEDIRKFDQIELPEKVRKAQLWHLEEYQNFASCFYILDPHIFNTLVSDIILFNNIRLLSDENLANIYEDLVHLLDDLEEMAITGVIKETGNRVYFYISGIAVDTNYSYIQTASYTLSMIKTLVLSITLSQDETSYKNIKTWINAYKRLSTLISVSGEKQRIDYFKEQRRIIEKIKK